jgi:hypothetical protein
VQDWPELAKVSRCKLLILTSTTPYSYIGVASKRGIDREIRLFEEKEAENREEVRFKTNLSSNIESLVYDDKRHPLHTPVEVKIVNISKNGIRISAKDNTLINDARFQIKIKIGENDKLLTGRVMNVKNVPPDECEYGCRLVGKDGDV